MLHHAEFYPNMFLFEYHFDNFYCNLSMIFNSFITNLINLISSKSIFIDFKQINFISIIFVFFFLTLSHNYNLSQFNSLTLITCEFLYDLRRINFLANHTIKIVCKVFNNSADFTLLYFIFLFEIN